MQDCKIQLLEAGFFTASLEDNDGQTDTANLYRDYQLWDIY